MKSTVFMRRTVIRKEMKDNLIGFRRIPAILPRLFDMEGMVYKLFLLYLVPINFIPFLIFIMQIVQDFNLRHPGLALIIYERWPPASKLIIKYAMETGIDFKKKLNIQKPMGDWTDGILLHFLFVLLL